MKNLIQVSDWDMNGLAKIAEQVLSEAKIQQASSCEVGIALSEGLSVSVRLGEVETLEHYRDQSLAITIYKGKRKGSANSSDLSYDAVRESVRAACSIAEYTDEDVYSGLADAELMAATVPDLDLYHPWSIAAEQAIELATRCESIARDTAGIENSEGATVTRYGGCALYANSNRFMGAYAGSRHSISCSVIAGKGDSMQRDYWYSVARKPEALETAEQIGSKAAQRALRRVGARKIKTGKVPVIFSAEMARSLFGHFISAISGSSLYRKASFLLDKKGSRIFPEYISISEQPHILQALGSAPYDNEGVATRYHQLVENGVLQDYVLDSYAARKLGTVTTGNAGGVHNLVIEPGKQTFDELIRSIKKGLLVTEMMGHGVNIVTGDYSRGVSGFWIENGEVQFPVEEITIAANLKDMLLSITAVANDVDIRGNIRTGSVLVENMMVAGS
ncbi:MAG: metalloprotease PmbA [Gammaproteobacteria bacterium]|nr:metalloprotease PmbA [Gammaproteobacteria bacterium]